MAVSLTSLILGTRRPLRIETALTQAEAERRIKSRIVSWGRDGLRGSVSEGGLSLYVVVPPFRQNSWRPVLDGRFEQTPSGTAVVGTVGFDRLVQFVLIAAIFGGFVWSARELVLYLTGSNPDFSLLQASKGLWVTPVVIAANYVGSRVTVDEAETLESVLRDILVPVSPNEALQPTLGKRSMPAAGGQEHR